MKIAVAQIKSDPGAVRENLKKHREYIGRARDRGIQLLVFPELSIPGYAHMDLAFHLELLELNKEAVEELAGSVWDIVVIVGFLDFEKKGNGPGGKPIIYNSAAVIENGKIIAVRDKTLLPTYDIFDERRYYRQGKRQGVVETQSFRLGIGICEDLWDEGYSTTVYQGLLKENPDILMNLSASPFHMRKTMDRYDRILQVTEGTQIPFIYANGVGSFDGFDGEVVFDGCSNIFIGEDLYAQGRAFEEDLVILDLENRPGKLPKNPAEENQELFSALVSGIQEYFRRNYFQTAYIGLSGGIDSALVAALCVEALGPERVIGITMPSHITSAETKDDAVLLAEKLGIRCDIRPIRDEYEAWRSGFEQMAGRKPESITAQNKQARIRGSILMEYTNEDRGGLVVSTGNKTELALGYCTLYGDMCGGFAAISDLSKTRVYNLARYVNKKAGKEIIPESIIDRAPTAELEEGQTDEQNLPADYDVLSPLVDEVIDNQASFVELVKKYDQQVVREVFTLIRKNEFKRRQAAPGIRVTRKAFGIGRRYPMGVDFAFLGA